MLRACLLYLNTVLIKILKIVSKDLLHLPLGATNTSFAWPIRTQEVLVTLF